MWNLYTETGGNPDDEVEGHDEVDFCGGPTLPVDVHANSGMDKETKKIIAADKRDDKASQYHMMQSLGGDEVDFCDEPTFPFKTHAEVNICICAYMYAL